MLMAAVLVPIVQEIVPDAPPVKVPLNVTSVTPLVAPDVPSNLATMFDPERSIAERGMLLEVKEPPSVRLPLVVTVPERVRP